MLTITSLVILLFTKVSSNIIKGGDPIIAQPCAHASGPAALRIANAEGSPQEITRYVELTFAEQPSAGDYKWGLSVALEGTFTSHGQVADKAMRVLSTTSSRHSMASSLFVAPITRGKPALAVSEIQQFVVTCGRPRVRVTTPQKEDLAGQDVSYDVLEGAIDFTVTRSHRCRAQRGSLHRCDTARNTEHRGTVVMAGCITLRLLGGKRYAATVRYTVDGKQYKAELCKPSPIFKSMPDPGFRPLLRTPFCEGQRLVAY